MRGRGEKRGKEKGREEEKGFVLKKVKDREGVKWIGRSKTRKSCPIFERNRAFYYERRNGSRLYSGGRDIDPVADFGAAGGGGVSREHVVFSLV